MAAKPKVAIFGPSPMLSITVESLTADGGDDIHVHAAGQGVWVARMAAELGADAGPLRLLRRRVGHGPAAPAGAAADRAAPGRDREGNGAYIHDRRDGERRPVAQSAAMPPSRHEIDDLFSVACAAAIDADVLALCGPYPGEALPLEIYGGLVTDVRANGTPVVVDLSPPRLDSALEGSPSWSRSTTGSSPPTSPARSTPKRGCGRRWSKLLDAGAQAAIITRAEEPALVVRGDEAWELIPPRFERGSREGCGDSMMGALAAAMAAGLSWEETLRTGAAAGAANFLRHGLGSGARGVVEELLRAGSSCAPRLGQLHLEAGTEGRARGGRRRRSRAAPSRPSTRSVAPARRRRRGARRPGERRSGRPPSEL